MAKILIIVKSNIEQDVRMALLMSQELKKNGAEDVRLLFMGQAINVLNKNFNISNLVLKEKENLKQNNIKVYACEQCMALYCINKEDLVHYDELSQMKIIVDLVNQGYEIISI